MDVHDCDAEKQFGVEIPVRKSRNCRMNRLVVAFIIQSLLTALCLAISIYKLMGTVQTVGKDIGIHLEVRGEVGSQMENVMFVVRWNRSMELEDNTRISFQCSGPYVVYVTACSSDDDSQMANGTLILKQPDTKWIIPIHSQDRCDGDHLKTQKDQKILSFTKHDKVSLRFTSDSLRLIYLHLGFHYLLGEQCFGHT